MRHLTMNHEMRLLGDPGRVVAYPFNIFGNEEQMRARCDVPRIFHHVGKKLAE